MIKNIIFDVGMVLVNFSWKSVMENLGFSEEEIERVARATVLSEDWNIFDRSKEDDEQILRRFIEKDPEVEAQICLFWEHIGETIQCFPYTQEWIKECKERGFSCFILSNYPRRTYELTKDELSFERFMDGALFSYQVQQIKPEPEIYKALLDKYDLKPEECVFFDDNRQNVEAAKNLGIHGILFTGKEEVMCKLEKLLEQV